MAAMMNQVINILMLTTLLLLSLPLVAPLRVIHW